MGHVARCLALADMLNDEFSVAFAIQNPDSATLETIKVSLPSVILLPGTSDYYADCVNFTEHLHPDVIVVLDGYHFNTAYQQKIKEAGCKVVYIDDLHAGHQVADCIINHAEGLNPSLYEAEAYTRFYLGACYALLRRPFLNLSGSRETGEVKKVFINMGAADKDNVTQKFAEALLELPHIDEIHVMLGAVNPNLAKIKALCGKAGREKLSIHINISAEKLRDLLTECDIAVCPASTISMEACAVGIGLLSGFTAENQKNILAGLKAKRVLTDLGNLNQVEKDQIRSAIITLSDQPGLIGPMIANQKKLIDGRSAARLKTLFRELKNEKLHFRFAKESDASTYFKWANDPAVRSNSFHQGKVQWDAHLRWFNSCIHNPDCYFYLFLNHTDQPVGQIRMSRNMDEVIIGISIDQNFRGQSLAPEMIKKACTHFFYRHPEEKITAYIKTENMASYKSFKKAGFTEMMVIDIDGFNCYKLEKGASCE